YKDITEVKKAEEKLKESEKRFRDVALSSADWIWEVDKNGRYTFASGKVKQILGYDPEEIIGKTPLELMPKEEAERIGKILEKFVSEKKPIVDLENWNLTKKGEKICLLTNGIPIIDEKGGLLGYRGVDKDITERKKAEEGLRKSEARYRSIFNSTTDSLLIFDLNGNIVEANPQACKMYGYPYEELIKLSGKDIVRPDYYYLFEKFKRDVQATGVFHAESVDIRKDGTQFNVEVRGSEFDYEGKKHLLAVIRDITERKKMEEILEHRLTALTQPLSEVSELKLTDIIDIEILQKIQDAFAHALGVASIILDLDCNPITKESNYCEVCRLIRKTVKGKKNCTESGITLSKKVKESMKPAMHSCQSIGFLEACVPIVVGGKHIANWFIGQSNTMDVDAKRIREYGKEIGADVDAMLAAFEKMPEMPIEKFKQILSLLWQIALDLSAYAYSTLRLTNEINMRKRAEEVLKEERDRAQKYLDVAGVMIIVVGADQKVTLINKRGCEILGYKEKEIIGKNWTDNFVPERNRDEVKTVLKKLFAGEIEPVEYNENVILTKSGKERIIAWHNSVLKDEAGNIIGILSSGEDITERKKMEAELRESEEKYRTTFENTGTAMAILEKDATISLANSRFEKLSGYSKEEIEGKMKWTEFVHPDDLKKMMEYHKERRVNPKEVPKQYEFRAINKNGNILYMLLNVDLIPGTKQSIVSLIDITEKKKMEKIRSVLYKITNAVSITKDLSELFPLIRKYLGEIIDTTNFLIGLYDKEHDTLSFTYKVDEKDKYSSFPLGKTLTAYVIRTGKSLLATEKIIEKLTKAGKIEPIGTLSKVWLGVPLKTDKEVVGVITVQSYKDASAYTEEDIKLLEFVSHQIAIIIKRKYAEETLQFERAQFLSIFDSINEIIYVTDPKTYKILYVNKAFKNAFQKDPVGGICYKEFQGLESPCEFCTNEIILKEKGKTYRWEYHNPILNRDYMIADRIIKWPDGRDVRFELAIDITDRKLLEQQREKA
ncbi:hypothetical protein DRN45_06485, partial [Thermococci archaeon]